MLGAVAGDVIGSIHEFLGEKTAGFPLFVQHSRFTAFLDASDYDETIRLAISLGGDADTLACIAGGIAEAFHGGVPKDIEEKTMAVFDDKLRQTVERFRSTYLNPAG